MSDTHTREEENKTSSSTHSQHEHEHQVAKAQSDPESQPAKRDARADDFSHGFWDKEIAPLRKAYLIGITRVTVAISLLIWGVVTIYWGSLWKSNELSPNISAYVINRDAGVIGTNISNILLSTNNGPTPHLTWTSIAPSQYPTTEAVETGVAVDEDAWVFVEILQDASARLDTARTNADASWDPASVIKVYYSEARNQASVDGIILGSVRGVLTGALPRINTQSTADFLTTNAANQALLTSIATTAPQTIAYPISTSYINLRPWSASVSIAPTFVGLIYAMILAFNITMGNFGMRQGIQRKLRLRSLILMRILVPLVAYVVLSMMFSMINLPFRLPFGGMGLSSDPYGAGFIIWWLFTFLGMAVLGLCTEAFLSLAGPQFIGFCLVSFIIINVSVANLPIELQVSLFRYGYAMPFYNLRQAYITIIYNTGRQILLLKYMGVLLAWLAVLFITLPIWIWLERRQALKAPAPAGPPGGH